MSLSSCTMEYTQNPIIRGAKKVSASSQGNQVGIPTQRSLAPSDCNREGEHLEAIALTHCLLKREFPGVPSESINNCCI